MSLNIYFLVAGLAGWIIFILLGIFLNKKVLFWLGGVSAFMAFAAIVYIDPVCQSIMKLLGIEGGLMAKIFPLLYLLVVIAVFIGVVIIVLQAQAVYKHLKEQCW